MHACSDDTVITVKDETDSLPDLEPVRDIRLAELNNHALALFHNNYSSEETTDEQETDSEVDSSKSLTELENQRRKEVTKLNMILERIRKIDRKIHKLL